MAGTILEEHVDEAFELVVSMESGLDGRNNWIINPLPEIGPIVSMESGLDGRNNRYDTGHLQVTQQSQWSPA